MSGKFAIVALSPNSWDGQWVNRQQLLSRLGKTHDIVYSFGPWSVWDRRNAELKAAPALGGFERRDNVWVDVPSRMFVRWPRLAVWDRFVVRLQAWRWRRRLSGNTPLVAYICHPKYEAYLNVLRPDYVVYHCYDLYDRQPGWTPELASAERRLLLRADIVFSPTTMLSATLMERAPCDAKALPNAADVAAVFAAIARADPEPADLAQIARPRIGYLGSIHPQLDLALVAELAKRRPRWNFVLIGPEQSTEVLHASAEYRQCRSLSNVHFLGEKHRDMVLTYLIHMDVNSLVYRQSAGSWTHVAYPLKLHEYLACGQPIVSVDLPMIREFDDVIAFAVTADEWEDALCAAVEGSDPADVARRRAIAAGNSWDDRVAILESWLQELPALRKQRLAHASTAEPS
jgi:glycosyltransferase involved in cell wall biosynthesis